MGADPEKQCEGFSVTQLPYNLAFLLQKTMKTHAHVKCTWMLPAPLFVVDKKQENANVCKSMNGKINSE